MGNWANRNFRRRYLRAYYCKNKKRLLKQQKKYRSTPERKRAERLWQKRQYAKDGGVSRRAYCRRWYARNKPKVSAGNRTLNWKLKLEVIAAYGGKCVCCPEDRPEFLTVDHKDGRGKHHRIGRRKIRAAGVPFYRWLRRRGFPKRNFQLLCFNCNWGKHWFGVCPHKLAREKTGMIPRGKAIKSSPV